MTNKIFNRATGVSIGLLVAFSGQALAFSPNHQEFSGVKPLHDSKIILALEMGGCDETLEPGVGVGVAVSIAVKAFDRSIAVVRTVSVTEQFPLAAKEAVIQALEKVSITLANALSSVRVDDNVAVATAVSEAISVGTGTAQVVAEADADAARAITTATACASQAQAAAGAEAGEI